MIGWSIDLPWIINWDTKFKDPIIDSISLQVISFFKISNNLTVLSVHLLILLPEGPKMNLFKSNLTPENSKTLVGSKILLSLCIHHPKLLRLLRTIWLSLIALSWSVEITKISSKSEIIITS